MPKLVNVFLILAAFLTACSATKKQFGQVIVEERTDASSAKEEIQRIYNLDDNIFDSASFIGLDHGEIKYRFFKPNQQKTSASYPLVIVYHGSGAIGSDNRSQLGIVSKLFSSPEIQKNYPAYVLAPQFSTRSSDYVFDTTRNLLSSTPRPCLSTLLQLIDSLKSSLNIDKNRIYVIGYSMGGSTVINSLAARPDLFAAGISISGIPQFDKTQELSEMPIWLIHGLDDTENPIDSDEQLYREINKNVRFWRLKGVTHDNVMTKDILGEALPRWLFKQHK
jgi:predicted peptidase